MEGYAAELDRIKKVLRENPRGMTVIKLSKELNINRNSAAKYLDILLVSGHVEMESVGPAKLYFLSQRIPASTLLNFSSDYILVLDRDFKVIQVNDNFLDLIGVKRENTLGKRIEDSSLLISTNPEIISKIKETIEGEGYKGEMSLSVAEKKFHFKVKLIPSTFDDGSPGVTIILDDVTEEKQMDKTLKKYHKHLEELVDERTEELKTTNEELQNEIVERKQLEDELRKSEVKNRAILDAIPDLMFRTRKDGTFLDYIAPSDDKLFVPPSVFMGRKVNEVMPEELAKQIMHCIEQVLQTKEMQTIQYQLPINGNIRDFEARIVVSGKNEVLAIATDVTERKNAEKVERESKNLLSAILDSLQTGVIIIDAETHTIVNVNPAAIKIIGAPKEKIVGKGCQTFICPAEKGKCPITDLKQTVYKSKCVLINANGERIPIFKTVTSAILNGQKHLVESFFDITHLKQDEDALQESEN